MVDPGEQVSLTLQREFSEEALNSLAIPTSEREKIHERITELFSCNGFQVSHILFFIDLNQEKSVLKLQS